MRSTRAILPCIVLLCGCFGPEGGGAAVPDSSVPDASRPDDWQVTHLCRGDEPRDAIEVLTARIEGDELFAQFRYRGDCEEHEYALCFAEEWQEENPVQIQVAVLHDAHGDACEAFVLSDDRFDLRPIAEEAEARGHVRLGVSVRLLLDRALDDGPLDYALSPVDFAIEQ